MRVSGIAYADALGRVVTGIRDAARLRIGARLIPSIDREQDPDEAVAIVEWMKAIARMKWRAGIDYRENDRPPEAVLEGLPQCARGGLSHDRACGRGMPWRNVETAIDLLQVDRVDHGYTIVDNPELCALCGARDRLHRRADEFVLRTLPPEQWAELHPMRKMPGLGLKIHPNTDDPTLHKVNPSGMGADVQPFRVHRG